MKGKLGIFLMAVTMALGVLGKGDVSLLNWRKTSYEPATPMLEKPPLSNLLQGAKLKVSGQWSDRGPHFVNDGKVDDNHWACEELPAVLTAELAGVEKIVATRVWFYFGDPRVYKFYIETSQDGNSWTRVVDWRENQSVSSRNGFEIRLERAMEARFARITITDSSVRGAGGHIAEWQLLTEEMLQEGKLRGHVVPLVRLDGKNTQDLGQGERWHGSAWRNERIHGQFAVWSADPVAELRLSCTELRSNSGEVLPRSAIQTRFLRYVLSDGALVGDVLDTAERVDLPGGGYRPLWLSVKVPANTRPDIYRGELKVSGAGGESVAFPIELEVLPATLPSPRDWNFYLDIWQHPWAVARYHGVEPFSAVHYALLEPIYRELADAGQRVLTTTIAELPWNHQNFDPYHTMIRRVKHYDGSWSSDYSLFDEYVTFGRKCGLGPDIHCYTMATWGNRVAYIDGVSGDTIWQTLKPGTPEHEAFWGPYLEDFQRHLVAKGWVGDVSVAMDERDREETKATADCVKKYAPLIKVAMPGNRPPSQFTGIDLSNYSQIINHVDDNFIKEAAERREIGYLTTFYICCFPKRPNTFTASPTAEQRWLGYYAEANGLDGMLRWAFCNWPRDPLYDTSFGTWAGGDTFFVYPGPRLSVRWEMLRDGIEQGEKIKILKKRGLASSELLELLKGVNFKQASKSDDAELADLIMQLDALVARDSRQIK